MLIHRTARVCGRQQRWQYCGGIYNYSYWEYQVTDETFKCNDPGYINSDMPHENNGYIYGGTYGCEAVRYDAVRHDENCYIFIGESENDHIGDIGTISSDNHFNANRNTFSMSTQCARCSGGKCERIQCSEAEDTYKEHTIELDD